MPFTVAIVAILVPMTLFMILAVIILTPVILKSNERARFQAMLRDAFERGQTVPPEFIAAMTGPPAGPERDLRAAIVLLAITAGFIALGASIAQLDTSGSGPFWPLLGVSAFPGFLGLGFLMLWWMGRKAAK
jgi:hypothetical protein